MIRVPWRGLPSMRADSAFVEKFDKLAPRYPVLPKARGQSSRSGPRALISKTRTNQSSATPQRRLDLMGDDRHEISCWLHGSCCRLRNCLASLRANGSSVGCGSSDFRRHLYRFTDERARAQLEYGRRVEPLEMLDKRTR